MPALIEVLLALGLSGLIAFSSTQVFLKCFYTIDARMTLKKLQTTIALARSHALITQEPVRICADKFTRNWTNGWNIQADNQIIKTFPKYTAGNLNPPRLFQNSACINIDKHGMTQNDGNFTYSNQGLLYNVTMTLTLNKGLCSYLTYEKN